MTDETEMFREFENTQKFLTDFRKLNQSAVVERILREYPRTRDSDKLLIMKVWETFGVKVPAWFVDAYMKILPCSESITRARRKAQERCPELRANDETSFVRDLQAEQMRKEVREGES